MSLPSPFVEHMETLLRMIPIVLRKDRSVHGLEDVSNLRGWASRDLDIQWNRALPAYRQCGWADSELDRLIGHSWRSFEKVMSGLQTWPLDSVRDLVDPEVARHQALLREIRVSTTGVGREEEGAEGDESSGEESEEQRLDEEEEELQGGNRSDPETWRQVLPPRTRRTPRPYACYHPGCDKAYIGILTLQRHFDHVHNHHGQTPFDPTRIPQSSGTVSTQPRPVTSVQQTKTGPVSSKRDRTMRKDQNGRPYQAWGCYISGCGKKYGLKEGVGRHVRIDHPDQYGEYYHTKVLELDPDGKVIGGVQDEEEEDEEDEGDEMEVDG